MVAGLGEPGGGRETNHDLISGEKVVELLQSSYPLGYILKNRSTSVLYGARDILLTANESRVFYCPGCVRGKKKNRIPIYV